MATPKKTHPADAADLALIPGCNSFTATILKNNKPQTAEFPTLGGARIEAARLNATANNGRKALVYAITAEGRAILVPASYGEPNPAKAAPADAPAKATTKPAKADDAKAKPAKAAKPVKPAKAKAAAKPKAKPEGKSKVEIVIAMLTGRKAITRRDIAEAVEWPSINIKAICARKGMKLRQAADGTLSASAPK
jgi:hypothetical protein